MIYLVQIPESYSHELYDSIANSFFKNERLNRKYEVIVTTYSGTDVKHTVLGDSFNKELYEAKKVFDIAVNAIFSDNSIKKRCGIRGASEHVSDKYGLEYGSAENAVIETILNCFELENREIEYKKAIEELEHKIKMLSL